jgi:hypothetical protein
VLAPNRQCEATRNQQLDQPRHAVTHTARQRASGASSRPLLPESMLSSTLQTELPWKVQLVEAPTPPPLLGSPIDVVQTGMRVGLRALEEVRGQARAVGPVLVCVSHLLMHIPVEPGTVDRWHAPQTLCRPGTLSCSASVGPTRSACFRIWLIPHEGVRPYTDSTELRHRITLARSTPDGGWGVPRGG